MENEERNPEAIQQQNLVDTEEIEAIELVLFQVSECYVYIIPPRKTASSYRADEWDVNKWAWEGSLKVISKGEECIIRLEDKTSGELYARAFLRKGEPHPVEPVIDSSRYFVLRIEENIGGRLRHAFIGIGLRERTQAYDFQAALHDHMKYLNKKQAAEEMEQQYQKNSSADYSLKEGETLVLQLKSTKICKSTKAKVSEQGQNNSSEEKGSVKEPVISIKPPPPPPATLSPTASANRSPENSPPSLRLEETSKDESLPSTGESGKLQKSSSNEGMQNVLDGGIQHASESESTLDIPDDDFGDFQTAG